MNVGELYFLKDSFKTDFNDTYIMGNKPLQNGKPRDRPYCIGYIDIKTNLFWMIPLSSEIDKYKRIYKTKLQKYRQCDTICFYKVLKDEYAFLIQNMVPVTQQYIKNNYLDSYGMQKKINKFSEKDLTTKTQKILHMIRNGSFKIFTDILRIEQELVKSIKK